ncbi:N-acetylmuramoyl-L-alanine amidase LytC precursor [Clostridioides difficile]|nr:N-acetylmuramoyl-L-alanine amidase LytC precursor [Clostridioides difficile]CZS11779.1 N-acetylmuramoyl-L-alanine amidase LytC precursor [Clostridioides difficile]
MNKKNIAIAMSGLTVLASAAPVFADDVTEYVTVQKDYKNTVKKLQEGITNGTITEVVVNFDNKKITTITPGKDDSGSAISGGEKLDADRKAKAETLSNAVNKQLDNLGDGDTVTFNVTYDLSNKIYSKSELDAYKTKLEEKVLYKPATADDAEKGTTGTAGTVIAKTNEKLAESTTSVYGKDIFNIIVEEDTTNGGYKLKVVENTAGIAALTAANVKYAAKLDTTEESTTAAAFAMKTGVTTAELVKGQMLDLKKSFENDSTKASESTGLSLIAAISDIRKANVVVINAKEVNIDIDSNSSDSAESLAKKYVFTQGELDTIYNDLNKNGEDATSVEKVGSKYQVVLYPEGKRLATKGAVTPDTPAKIVLKSEKVKDLKDYVDDLRTYNNSYSNSITVAGDDRIETAIELSKKYYNSDDTNALFNGATDAVVLVGSQSIVDGLVASPLASEKHAPLLLTSNDKLDSNVKSEIKRVMDLKTTSGINTSKKVYIAGGVNSVSKAVEDELKDMGLKVTRLSGDDRYETSLEIADEIGLDNDKAFVVGGTGLADAMSIAPVASQLKDNNGKFDVKDGDATPIVVVDGKAKTLSTAAADFLDNANVDIIGGVNSVSKDVEDAIDDATGNDPDRISGEDRQSTNAEVMKNTDYFDKNDVSNYFVAKDGSTKEDQLVDALAAAAVAGNFGATVKTDNSVTGTVSPAPIILATDTLSTEQNVAISKTVNSDNSNKNLVQVGKGIADSVINKVKSLLDM